MIVTWTAIIALNFLWGKTNIFFVVQAFTAAARIVIKKIKDGVIDSSGTVSFSFP